MSENNLKQLNKNSLQDNRVNIMRADAFLAINELLNSGQVFDAIIVDLPDPSHPDLNKLYSALVNFFQSKSLFAQAFTFLIHYK